MCSCAQAKYYLFFRVQLRASQSSLFCVLPPARGISRLVRHSFVAVVGQLWSPTRPWAACEARPASPACVSPEGRRRQGKGLWSEGVGGGRGDQRTGRDPMSKPPTRASRPSGATPGQPRRPVVTSPAAPMPGARSSLAARRGHYCWPRAPAASGNRPASFSNTLITCGRWWGGAWVRQSPCQNQRGSIPRDISASCPAISKSISTTSLP